MANEQNKASNGKLEVKWRGEGEGKEEIEERKKCDNVHAVKYIE